MSRRISKMFRRSAPQHDRKKHCHSEGHKSRRIFSEMFRSAQHDRKSTVILRDVSPEESSLRCFAPLNMTIKGTVILRDASPEESLRCFVALLLNMTFLLSF